MYLETLTKLAMEEVIPANEGALGDSAWLRRIRNAALIAGGVGLGTAAGTAAASYLSPHIPEAIKGAWLPTGLGLSAGALSWLKSEKDAQRDRDIQEANSNRVLLRVPQGDEGRVRDILQQIRPQKTSTSVHMTSQPGELDPKFRREIMLPEGATDRDIGETVWGTKQASAPSPLDFWKLAVNLSDLRTAYKAVKPKSLHIRRGVQGAGDYPTPKSLSGGVNAQALDPAPRVESFGKHRMVDAMAGHGLPGGMGLEKELRRMPKPKVPTIVQSGDVSKQVQQEAFHRGIKTPTNMSPTDREGFNRATFLHEAKELDPGPGVFRFANHANLQPMLQDMNIAATAAPEIKGTGELMRNIRGPEIEHLKGLVPEAGRLNLGNERLSRHGRKRLQQLYDKRQMQELGTSPPSSTWVGEGARQVLPNDYKAYGQLRKEMFPQADTLPQMASKQMGVPIDRINSILNKKAGVLDDI